MIWIWVAVGAAVWVLVAITVSLVVCRAVRLRDERERPVLVERTAGIRSGDGHEVHSERRLRTGG